MNIEQRELSEMIRNIIIGLVFVLLLPVASAKDQGKANKKEEAKALSGISIVGNKEAPKSLFIVPWKSSELGVETGLTSKLLNEEMKVVDKDVFQRELDFYSAAEARQQ